MIEQTWRKGKLTSSEKKAAVIAAKINNPDLSTRDIQKKTGVSKSVVATTLKNDLGQVRTKSENIANLIDRNKELHTLIDAELKSRLLDDDKTWIRTSELTQLKWEVFKQDQVLWLDSDVKKDLKVTFEI